MSHEELENEGTIQTENDIPINEKALEKQNSEFEIVKKELSEFLGGIDNEENFKLIQKNIVSFKERIDALFLIDSDLKEPLLEDIQNNFQKISEERDKIREERNKLLDENLQQANSIFEEANSKAMSEENFKNSRTILIELQGKIREIDLRTGDKDSLLSKIQESFDSINNKQQEQREAFEMECSENYLLVKPKVTQVVDKAKSIDRYNDSRKLLIEMQKEIKQLTLTKNQRDELYQMIRVVFNEINEKQDKEREGFLSSANENYEKLKPEVDKAIEFAANPDNFASARSTLIEAQGKLKEAQLTKEHRDELFGAIREVFNKLNDISDEKNEEFQKEADSNFISLEVKVNEAVTNVEYSSDFKDIREGLISVQDEVKVLKLSRNQRNDLLSRIRKGFEKFDAKRDEFYNKRRIEKADKLNSIIENLNEKIERLNESISQDKEQLNSFNERLETEDDKDKIQEMISSVNEKISQKETTIKESQARIDDIKSELEKMNS